MNKILMDGKEGLGCAHRDTRWPERAEVNRQITDLKVISECIKDLILKSCSS
ncbi:MAG: hypothetical protein HOF76_03320 [Candidatus Scalindua sp.]|nr:hypothetical protein [Candidatus Scalindua sp.]MBT6049004.1 hypothetical protein [Candidatus Scalindua sp.]